MKEEAEMDRATTDMLGTSSGNGLLQAVIIRYLRGTAPLCNLCQGLSRFTV
jgi:hypothetical protein